MLEFVSKAERPSTAAVGTAVVVLAWYIICKCLYNLYFHPLSKFPGPKLAAIGFLYEFYYDVIKDGTYLWEIEKMHRRYGKEPNIHHPDMFEARTDSFPKGPIVRVTPRELHIQDPQYYSSIYSGGSRRVNKDPTSVGAFDVPTSTAATVDHDLHRARRGYLNPYFSKRSMVGLESVIHERIGKLCMRLEEAMHQGQVISLDAAFSALTADVITLRFYGQHFDYLSIKDFSFVVRDAFLGLSLVYHLARFLPILVKILKGLPVPIIRMIMPSVADLLALREEIKHNGVGSLQEKTTTESKSVIAGSLGDPNIPAEERTIDRLLDEGIVIIFAGTETTSRALSVTMFYLLNNRSVLKRLCDELDTLPSRPDNAYSLSQLEPLPFLVSFPADHRWSVTKMHLTCTIDRCCLRRSPPVIWSYKPSSESGDS